MWYSEFLRRFPPPPNSGHEISPESLDSCASGFRLRSHERFEIGLMLDLGFCLNYVLTETTVAHTVHSGTPQ
jgi:hypothetical protein